MSDKAGFPAHAFCIDDRCQYCLDRRDMLAAGINPDPPEPETFYQAQARRLRYWRTLDDHDLEVRDAAWIERNLGDVPTRWVHGHRTMDDFDIPVESLGREIEDAGLDGCDVQYPVLIF